MSSTLEEFERINQLSANLTKYSTKEQVEFYLLDKYDLWNEYLRTGDKNENMETSRTERQ